MSWPLLLSTLLLAGQAGSLFPAPKPNGQVESLLARMRAAYSKVKTAKLSTTCTLSSRAASISIESDFEFKAPNSFRIESKGVPGLDKQVYTVVTDGKEVLLSGLPGKPTVRPYNYREIYQDLPQINLETMSF